MNDLKANQIKSLLILADRAKTVQDWRTANIVWGIIFYAYDRGLMESHVEDEISMQYEKSEPRDHGEIHNTHWDLAVLEYDGVTLNIPIPLLSQDTALKVLLMGATVVPKREHNRETTEPQDLSSAPEILLLKEQGWDLDEVRGLVLSDSD